MIAHRRISTRQAKLSPAKQALLAKRMRGELKAIGPKQTSPQHPPPALTELSFAQEGLWFFHQLDPHNPAYNIPVAYRLKGSLNLTALARSFNEIVRRHESLRTTFPSVAGRPQPVIVPYLTLELPLLSLEQLDNATREAEVHRLLTEEAQQPFDLATGPLLRVKLLRLNTTEHVLCLNIHHIIADGWSVRVLMSEVGLLYDAFGSGKVHPLAKLSIQYADYVSWQRRWLQGDVLTSQLDYWKQQLKDIPPRLALPFERPRPALQSYHGATQTFTLSSTLTAKIKTLSQQAGATLFMTLLAAFQTLLYRYTGQEDILVGSPIANHPRLEYEVLIGLFINTLVLRTHFSGNPTFQELLKQVRQTALEAYSHQDLPFEMLVEHLQPARHPAYHPLFQVMFAFQQAVAQTIELDGLIAIPLAVDNKTTKFDLTLFMEETTFGLRGMFEYNTDLFDEATIGRMLDHYQHLLEAIEANPDGRIAELPLLSESERQQLLVEWNNTQADYPQVCLHELFEAQVERTPEAIALIFKQGRLTYRELNRRANQLAHYLQSVGVGPETLVGLCMERSPEMMVGLLGILKAGGAYLPLDPADPPERLAFILADAQTPVVLTHAPTAHIGASHATAHLIPLDTDWPAIAQYSDQNLASSISPDNLAYVIYTSGSTGQPKGVMILHRGVVNYLSWCLRAYPVTAGVGAPVHSSISFDMTVTALFAPLLVGRAVYMLPQAGGVEALPAALQSGEPFSLVKLTPAHLEVLNQQLPAVVVAGRAHALIIGGENLLAETIAFWQDNAPDTLLVNEYGPTETVVGCCVYQVPSDQARSGSIPIGRPIANTQLYILDPYLQPVPIGVPGELYIGGAGVARGYLNRPDLTREKFIPNPFGRMRDENGRMKVEESNFIPHPSPFILYKTGDLARYRPDGNIEFLGRLDDQVKLRGYRIELGEIEAVLRQHPVVQEAAVVVREDTPGDKRLVAYVVSREADKLKSVDFNSPTRSVIEQLNQFLRQKLPEYMIPVAIVLVEALPLTANGKIDHRVLPLPNAAGSREQTFAPPQDAVEIQLVKIWEEILDVRPISIADNFFELGGHSLLAVRLFARLADVFGRKLPVSTLFQAPTIELLAEILRREGWTVPHVSLVPIQASGSKPPFFCVHGMGGGVLDYADLAWSLGPEQPFYGLQERGFDGVHEPFTRIEDMAAHYIKEIQAVQPTGPYLLGGYCYGGTVAFEMARQLQTQGQAVALLAIIDNTPPNSDSYEAIWQPAILVKFLRNLPYWLRDFAQLAPGDMIARVWRKIRLAWHILNRRGQPGNSRPTRADIEAIIDRDFAQIPEEHHKFLEAHYLAWLNYIPQPYAGRVTLLRTRRYSLLGPYDPYLGWGKLAAGVEVRKIIGFHGNILQPPYVQRLAEELRTSLDEARTAQATPEL